jgi:large repetitive protein
MNRGQATAEMALILPVIGLMLGATTQAGILISDQVNLNQAAYEAAQWAISNRSSATVDSGGTPGTIAQHAYTYLCGSTRPAAVGSGHHYCETRSGLPDLSVTVSSSHPAALRQMPGPLQPVTNALAANGCKNWKLTLSPKNPPSISAGSTQTYTVTMALVAGGSPDDTDDPSVSLHGGGYPRALQNGNPVFNPPTVMASRNTSQLVIVTSSSTPPGTYTISISGQDQCGSGPTGGDSSVTLVVTAATGPPPPSPSPSSSTSVTGISPTPICPSTPTSVTVAGVGFQAGAAVTAGSQAMTSVTVVSSGQITANTPALAAGTYNITVTNPGGSSGVLVNALTAQSSCASPSPSPSASASPVSAGVSCAAGTGQYETLITITWASPAIVPLISGPGLPYFTLTAAQVAFCQ